MLAQNIIGGMREPQIIGFVLVVLNPSVQHGVCDFEALALLVKTGGHDDVAEIAPVGHIGG